MKNKNVLPTITLWAIGIVFLIPIYWVLVSSLKSDEDIVKFPPTFFPDTLVWNNYPDIWSKLNFGVTFTNSLVVAVPTVILTVLFSSMAGFAFSKKRFLGRDVLFSGLIATMIIPPTVLMLPVYFIITKLGMFDSLLGLILPFSVSVFAIFFTKQYIDDIPDEMLEAAKMDGAGDFRTFVQIIIPLIRPAITALVIIDFVQNWNSFTMPLVLLQSESHFTLPLKLAMMLSNSDNVPWSKILAANVLSLIPALAVFLVLQKQFVNGLMAGAVKG
ncbi:carbohydrate ABC transporter permease [Paenibacillus sp. V4I5]|uniref:carbohydrate ABC transporter permease n=1 Tax=Paenibacillus sp. V4I5 TaxID=3042306 RepID=UPI00278DBE34|nr:carbohydrate ABC transporter permease [Paenibacillus sp. V4I5]MDQ0913927.1 ABC-type glycerol-3-phosphate transport system permease component [Paenibacillus sp. V4I5]